MVSFKQLAVIGAVISQAVFALPSPNPNGNSLSIRHPAVDPPITTVARDSNSDDAETLSIRQDRGNRPMALQHSPQGRVLFLIGARLPPGVLQVFEGYGRGGPGRVMLEHYYQWVMKKFEDSVSSGGEIVYQYAVGLLASASDEVAQAGTVSFGGVYPDDIGVSPQGELAGDIGFLLQTVTQPEPEHLRELVNSIKEWALSGGLEERLLIIKERANDFINLNRILGNDGPLGRRHEKRARKATCANVDNLLQYAYTDVAIDADFDNHLRYAGRCLP